MKKTLITLLALGGIAMAGEIKEYALTLTDGSHSITTGNKDLWAGYDGMELKSYLLEFTIDAFGSSGYNVTTVVTSRGSDGSERSGLTMLTWLGSNAGIGDGSKHYNNSDGTNSMTFAVGDTIRMAFDAETEIAYLYNATNSTLCTVNMSETVTDDNAALYYFTSGTMNTDSTVGSTSAWTNGGKDKYTFSSVYDLSSIAGNSGQFASFVKTKAIPEPATATLSLLALCGLAARRRRK